MREMHFLHLNTSELCFHMAESKNLKMLVCRKVLVWWYGHHSPSGVGCFMTPLPGAAGAIGEHFFHPMDCCFRNWA